MTSNLLLRLLERIHGHLGWLTVAALAHPAIILRNPRRRARLSASLAAGMAGLAGGLGAYVYPSYRVLLKRQIFTDAPAMGWLFERKEHLAVGAVGFAIVGCVAHLVAPVIEDELARLRMARIAHRSFVFSLVFTSIVAVLGVTVAVFRTF